MSVATPNDAATDLYLKRVRVETARIHYETDFAFLTKFFHIEPLTLQFPPKPTVEPVWTGPFYSGLDIETEGTIDPHAGEIATVQMELNGDCYVVHWHVSETLTELPYNHLFRAYLESPKVTKVIHNAKFELAWFIKAYGWDLHPKAIHDTMAGDYILAEGAGLDDDNPFRRVDLALDGVVYRRYKVDMDKDQLLRTGFRRRGATRVYPLDKKYLGGIPKCQTCTLFKVNATHRVGTTNVCGVCYETRPEFRTKANKLRAAKDIDHSLYVPKTELKGDLTERELKYAAFDALWAAIIAEDQIAEMTQKDLFEGENYLNILQLDSSAAECIARMELRGIPVDVEKLYCIGAEWQYEEQELREDIEDATCFTNVLPKLQIHEPELTEEFLPTRLGYWKDPTPAAIKKAEEAGLKPGQEGWPQPKFVLAEDVPKITSQEQMVPRLQALGFTVPSYEGHELRHFKDDPLIAKILEYKQVKQLLGTYVEGFLKRLNKHTQRVHGSFNQYLTSTGRFSSSDPNLQNLPSKSKRGGEVRSCVWAGHGRKLVIADYSQLELRLIAEMYVDFVMRDMFNKGLDLHSSFAAKMLGVSYEEMEAGKEGPFKTKRAQAKPANFGLGYGAGVDQFMFIAWSQYGIVLTREEATNIRAMWLEMYQGVRQYHEKTKTMLKTGTGPVRERTQLGRTRRLQREWRNDKGERKTAYAALLNHPIQGTGADGVKIAMVQLIRQLPEDAYLILQVHDELVVDCREEDAEYVKDLMERTMVSAMQPFLKTVPCLVDAKISDRWTK